ncbi:MAG: hypothetical protein ACLTEH_05790 [Clostridia bacterium]
MEKYKIANKLDLKDFKKMEQIEHNYFPNENVTVAEEVYKWYLKNPDTCFAILNETDEVIASCNLLPLKPMVIEKIMKEQLDEATITDKQIEVYEEGKVYDLYLSAISIDPAYRNQISILKLLIKKVVAFFVKLEEQNITIRQIMAEASTKQGENICKKLLKMVCQKELPNGTKFYVIQQIDKEEILEQMKRIIH